MKTFRLLGVAVLILGCVTAYPGGAPRNICGRYVPGHANTETPVNNGIQSGPYAIDVTAGQGQSLTVTLRGNMFKGFVIQAMPSWKAYPEGPDDIMGTFQVTGQSQLRSCGAVSGSDVLTHNNPSMKTSVSATWQPPSNLQGQVKFLATVVRDFNSFYVVNSTAITVEELMTQGTAGGSQSSQGQGQASQPGTQGQGQGSGMTSNLNIQPLPPPPPITPAFVGFWDKIDTPEPTSEIKQITDSKLKTSSAINPNEKSNNKDPTAILGVPLRLADRDIVQLFDPNENPLKPAPPPTISPPEIVPSPTPKTKDRLPARSIQIVEIPIQPNSMAAVLNVQRPNTNSNQLVNAQLLPTAGGQTRNPNMGPVRFSGPSTVQGPGRPRVTMTTRDALSRFPGGNTLVVRPSVPGGTGQGQFGQFPSQTGQPGPFFQGGQFGPFGQPTPFPTFSSQAAGAGMNNVNTGFNGQVFTPPGQNRPPVIRVPLGSTLEQELRRLGRDTPSFGQGQQFGQVRGMFGPGGQFGQGVRGLGQGGQFGNGRGIFGQGGQFGRGPRGFEQSGQFGQGMGPFGQQGRFGQRPGMFGQGGQFGQGGAGFRQDVQFGQDGGMFTQGSFGQGRVPNQGAGSFGQGQTPQAESGVGQDGSTGGNGGLIGQGGQVGQGGQTGQSGVTVDQAGRQFGQAGQTGINFGPGQTALGGNGFGQVRGQIGQSGQFFSPNGFQGQRFFPPRGGFGGFNAGQFRPFADPFGQRPMGQFGAGFERPGFQAFPGTGQQFVGGQPLGQVQGQVFNAGQTAGATQTNGRTTGQSQSNTQNIAGA